MDAEEILNLLADDHFISLTNGRGWTLRYVFNAVEGFMHDGTLDNLLRRFADMLDKWPVAPADTRWKASATACFIAPDAERY